MHAEPVWHEHVEQQLHMTPSLKQEIADDVRDKTEQEIAAWLSHQGLLNMALTASMPVLCQDFWFCERW